MEVDYSIAPDSLRATFTSLNNAFVNTRSGVSEIHILSPECYGFARRVPCQKWKKTNR
jgi:hypothetical protein